MRKALVIGMPLMLIALSYGNVMAAPPTQSVIVSNAPSQPIPITALQPLDISVLHKTFTLYDSGFVSSPLDLEVATTGCGSLMACVFNNSVGATNLPITLSLEFLYPPLSPPGCSGSGLVGVSLLSFTVDSLSSKCSTLANGVMPPCLRVATDGPASSYAVILLCQ